MSCTSVLPSPRVPSIEPPQAVEKKVQAHRRPLPRPSAQPDLSVSHLVSDRSSLKQQQARVVAEINNTSYLLDQAYETSKIALNRLKKPQSVLNKWERKVYIRNEMLQDIGSDRARKSHKKAKRKVYEKQAIWNKAQDRVQENQQRVAELRAKVKILTQQNAALDTKISNLTQKINRIEERRPVSLRQRVSIQSGENQESKV